jgi:hypothetical protein
MHSVRSLQGVARAPHRRPTGYRDRAPVTPPMGRPYGAASVHFAWGSPALLNSRQATVPRFPSHLAVRPPFALPHAGNRHARRTANRLCAKRGHYSASHILLLAQRCATDATSARRALLAAKDPVTRRPLVHVAPLRHHCGLWCWATGPTWAYPVGCLRLSAASAVAGNVAFGHPASGMRPQASKGGPLACSPVLSSPPLRLLAPLPHASGVAGVGRPQLELSIPHLS